MKFRILRRVVVDYGRPAYVYYFQQRFFLFWSTIYWSTEFEDLKSRAEKYVYDLNNMPEDKVMWETKV